ncbi:hypothetical protein PENNAL_c0047G00672, partial [Penicillium nalgiovense]
MTPDTTKESIDTSVEFADSKPPIGISGDAETPDEDLTGRTKKDESRTRALGIHDYATKGTLLNHMKQMQLLREPILRTSKSWNGDRLDRMIRSKKVNIEAIHAQADTAPSCAARWNFINFQTPTYSAIMMEYTTPPSYGSTTVNVGGIVKEGEVIYAGTTNSVAHTETGQDEGTDWPAPKSIKWEWSGKTTGNKALTAEVNGALGSRLDRIDVMAEVPGFIKSIAGSVAGTRPYIFQYSPQEKLSLKLKLGDEEITEEGTMFSESTFI